MLSSRRRCLDSLILTLSSARRRSSTVANIPATVAKNTRSSSAISLGVREARLMTPSKKSSAPRMGQDMRAASPSSSTLDRCVLAISCFETSGAKMGLRVRATWAAKYRRSSRACVGKKSSISSRVIPYDAVLSIASVSSSYNLMAPISKPSASARPATTRPQRSRTLLACTAASATMRKAFRSRSRAASAFIRSVRSRTKISSAVWPRYETVPTLISTCSLLPSFRRTAIS